MRVLLLVCLGFLSGCSCSTPEAGDAGTCPDPLQPSSFCGANTALDAGKCVATCSMGTTICGANTVLDGGACVASCASASAFCGPGTTFDAGTMLCVGQTCPDPASLCGPGTFFDPRSLRCAPGTFSPTPTSLFTTGSEAWSIVDLAGATVMPADYASVLAPLDITWNPVGGLDGGYISRRDITSNVFFFNAPDTFLGDQSAYRLGKLRFSLKCDASDYLADAFVVLIGNNGNVAVAPITAPATGWTQYVVPLDVVATAWRANRASGALLTQSQLDAILADLEALRINGEWGSNVTETTGLDQVSLTGP